MHAYRRWRLALRLVPMAALAVALTITPLSTLAAAGASGTSGTPPTVPNVPYTLPVTLPSAVGVAWK